MELQEGADTPEPPPPGKMNRTAFKLFVKRRSGGAMPSIFGVRSKSRAPALSRSQTQEGLAEAAAAGPVMLERSEAAPPGDAPGGSAPRPHGFFSLLRKGGGGRGEPAPSQHAKAAPRQRRGGGLRGLLSGMQRWRRGPDTGPPPGEPPAQPPPRAASPPQQEEAPPEPEEDESPLSSLHIEDILQEAAGRSADPGSLGEEALPPPAPPEPAPAQRAGLLFADAASLKSFDSLTGCGDITADPGEEERPGGAEPAPGELVEPHPAPEQPPPMLTYQGGGEEMASPEGVEEAAYLQDFWQEMPASPPHPTGEADSSASQDPSIPHQIQADPSIPATHQDPTCMDIAHHMREDTVPSETAIRRQEETMGSAHRLQEESMPKCGTYHRRGDTLPRDSPHHLQNAAMPRETGFQPQEEAVPKGETYHQQENSRDTAFHLQNARDSLHKHSMPRDSTPHLQDDSLPRGTVFQPQEGSVPRDTACQLQDPIPRNIASQLQEDTMPRVNCSGGALNDRSVDPKLHLKGLHSEKDSACVTSTKPLSPVTTTCPLKSASGGGAKDSKIPISIRHLPLHPPPSHVTDTCTSPQPPPTKSEIPRTKIPVSKVLVRRVSNRVLTGTTYKTCSFQDTAKK